MRGNGIGAGHAGQGYAHDACETMRSDYTSSCQRVEGGGIRPAPKWLFSVLLYAGLLLQTGLLRADDLGSKSHLLIAQSAASEQSSGGNDPAAGEEKRLSPEQKMRRRFPQPVKAGDLIGLPVLDWDDVTIGHVRHVVRTPAGKIQLIVTYGGFFGWGQRLVPVPIEVVAILGRQLAALDMSRAEFDKAPAWSSPQTVPIPPTEMIQIAITRR
jgi:PRC-barrel domain